jgi:hypothetical protein
MAYHVFGGRVPDSDDDLFLSGRFSYSVSGSEMKIRSALLLSAFLLWAAPAFSQGCAMCYSSAVAASKDGQKAISRGVIVLVLPPAGFMTVGIWMAQRYARKRDLEQCESV